MEKGILIEAADLSRCNTWRVGGVAEKLYRPKSINDLSQFLKQLPENEPLYWIGFGSNLLVRDGGLKGTVILTQGTLEEIEQEGTRIRVEAGCPAPKLSKYCAEQGLTGLEFLCGVPGSIGGALAMNAGAYGGETWNLVEQVDVIDRLGRQHCLSKSDFQVGYRSVKLPGEYWFLAGYFNLSNDNSEACKEKVKSYLKHRASTQPVGKPSGGSVFQNPKDDYAARLIESCGLKGFHIGGAFVSEKHANFIINQGNATAKDIEDIILAVKQKVQQDKGVELTPEVRIIGEDVAESNGT